MVKKDKKAKAAEKKLRTAAKLEKKTSKTATKAHKKQKLPTDDSSEDDNADLDALLADYAAKQAAHHAITESPLSAPPSPRTAATLLPNPQSSRELFLFGGEYYDGALARFYNDLCVYHTRRDVWTAITSPNSPLPRSGHAWCVHTNSKIVYLFGGEFSSPKQGTFYHYADFWQLHPSTREWTRLDPRGKPPSPRSGHRMTSFKQYVVIFGGFRDTAGGTTYLNDVVLYDTQKNEWVNPQPPPGSQRPDPRSSCSLLPHEGGAVLVGGYSRVKGSVKGAQGGVKVVEKPCVWQDVWFLRIALASADAGGPTIRWERRKKAANPPNPPRAGATMAPHRGRGILFGGVWDTEASEEGIESEFFNQLWVWNVERNRYFQLNLRRPRARKNMEERGGGGRGAKSRQDEEELLARLRELEAKYGGSREEVDELKEEEEDEEAAVEKPVLWEMPHQRFNAQLAVVEDVVYIFGGTFEKGDREFTFDEMWAIDLGKLDGCKEVFRREVQDWVGEEDDDEEDEEDEEDDEEEDEDGEQASPSGPPSLVTDTTASVSTFDTLLSPAQSGFMAIEEREETASQDTGPHPRAFESLRGFYARTSQVWQEIILEDLNQSGEAVGKSIKEVKKGAFELAEEKWWGCREEIQAMEDEQEEAGIAEVVNLKEKQANTSGGAPARRR